MKSWKRHTTRPQILSNSSIGDVDSRHKRKQAENSNKDAIGVKREKKHRIVENKHKNWDINIKSCQCYIINIGF